MAVGEVDRRVLVSGIDAELWLITCVWSRIGQIARHCTLVPARGVDEAEGCDREQVGDEEQERNE